MKPSTMRTTGLVLILVMMILSAPACIASETYQAPVVAPIPGVVPTPIVAPVFAVETISEDYRATMTGVSWKEGCPVPFDKLRLVKVGYIGFDGSLMQGELVVHQAVAEEVTEIFRDLYSAGYPIKGIALVDKYNGDDTSSMDADNTSAFNYRPVAGSKTLSKHSYGIAIDINPIENPYVKGKVISPLAGASYTDRSLVLPGMIIPGDPCHQAFVSRGWTWGGDWKTLKDYQHFEKPLNLSELK